MMMYRILFILFFIAASCKTTKLTVFQSNHCDSLQLSPSELEKCRLDAYYEENLVSVVNYASHLKTKVLPGFRKKRAELNVSKEIRDSISVLRSIYDSVLKMKQAVWNRDMDRNQNRVMSKALASSILQMEIFWTYPDVYAVVLNPLHTSLEPRSDPAFMMRTYQLVLWIHQSLNEGLRKQVQEQSKALDNQMAAFPGGSGLKLLQGEAATEDLAVYQLVNYLVWVQ